MKKDLVSVIICHHKGRLIYKAIETLLAQREVDVEIIVATSIDGLEFPGVRSIFVTGGPAHKRNVAYRFAKGDYIAFFDDDIEAAPHAIFYMLEELKRSGIGMVFGKLLNMEFRDRFDEAGSFLTWTGFLYARADGGIKDIGQFQDTCTVLAGKSAACLVRRDVFWRVGGFDISYEILGEETDLAWRVWLYGHRVLYVPRSVTYHAFNTRFKPADFYVPRRVYYNGCRNYLTMLYTNLGRRRWILPVALHTCVWFSAAIGMLLTGKSEAGVWILRGLGYFYRNIYAIWQKRVHVQRKIRRVSDASLIPMFMLNPPASYYIARFCHYIKTGRHG